MPAETTSSSGAAALVLKEPQELVLNASPRQIIGLTVDGAVNGLTEVRVRTYGPRGVNPADLIGARLEIELPLPDDGNGSNKVVYGGEIFEVTLVSEFPRNDQSVYDLVALPNFARARYGRRIKEFKEKSLKDVLSDLASDYSLGSTFDMESESWTYEHLLQFIETDFDFFNRCLQRNGLNFAARVPAGGGTQLSVFRTGAKPNFAQDHTLVFGEDVEFTGFAPSPEANSYSGGESDTIARFWSDEVLRMNRPYGQESGSSEPFFGHAATGMAARGIQTVSTYDRNYLDPNKATFGTATSKPPVAGGTDSVFPAFAPTLGQTVTNTYAAGQATLASADKLGVLVDVPDGHGIQVGDKVKLDGFLAGMGVAEYLVARQQLSWDRTNARSTNRLMLRNVDTVAPPATHLNPPYRGLLTGIVSTDASDDPEKLGRVKVRFPVEPQLEGAWCRVVRPYAGDQRGMQFDPHLDDEVLVGFLHDDPDRPVVMGSLHFGGQTQPFESQPYSGAYVAGIKMKSGNELSFHEESGEEKIYTYAKKDHETKVENDQTTTVENDHTTTVKNDHTTTVKNDLTIDTTGKTTIKSEGAMLVDGKGKITIEDTQSIELKVGGSSIKIETAKITISSPMVTIDAKGQLEAKASGTAKLSASGIVEVQGGIVKIN